MAREPKGGRGLAHWMRAVRQPDGISCGPACLGIVAGGLLARRGVRLPLNVFQLRETMGTNGRKGTTEAEMAAGMAAFGITHRRTVPAAGASRERTDELREWLDGGGAAVLRTMRHGWRHWVVAAGNAPGGAFKLLDPATGTGIADADEVEAFMAPRGWEMWLVPADSPCRRLSVGPVGDDLLRREAAVALLGGDPGADWDASPAVCDGDEVLACLTMARRGVAGALGDDGPIPDGAASHAAALDPAAGEVAMRLRMAVAPGEPREAMTRLLNTAPGDMGLRATFALVDSVRGLHPGVTAVGAGERKLLVRSEVPLGPARIQAAGRSVAQVAEFERPPGPHR